MSVLVKVALDWLRAYLISKLVAVDKVFTTVVSLVLDMIYQGYLVFTDNVVDNRKQLREIWQVSFVPLLGAVLAGATAALKNEAHRQQVLAVLKEAVAKLENSEPTFSEV